MKVIIIGGNAAGMSAAAKFRRLDSESKIIVFEKGKEVSYGSCGLPYYISGLNNDLDALRIRSPKEFKDKANIEIRMKEEVTDLDSPNKKITVTKNDGETYTESYDKLVVTTGASPVFPPFPGKELDNIFTLKTLEDGERIKEAAKSKKIKNVTIVGSGFIGMELAESFVSLGKKLRIIEMMPRVMNNYEPEITDVLVKELKKNDVSLCFSEAVKSFEGDGAVSHITTDKNTYPTDMVIVSIGVSPNTTFLRDTKGLNFFKNGAIIVNKRMETGIPNIYAGGDCATVYDKITNKPTYIALATNANKQGKIIGQNLAGHEVELPGRLGTSALKFMDLEIAMTGASLNAALNAGYNAEFSLIKTKLVPPYYESGSKVLIKLIFDKDTKQVLGACMAGASGTALRINVFATAISAGMTINDISNLDLAYSPPFSHAWDAVQVAANAVK